MVRPCAEGPNFVPTGRIPANIPVNHIASLLVIDIVNGKLLDQPERLLFDWDILGSLPQHTLLSLGVLDDPLLSLLACLHQTGVGTQGTVVRDHRFGSVDVRWLLQKEGDFV